MTISTTPPTPPGHPETLRSVDRSLLLCLRSGQPRSIGELTESLGVTATAVRQRLERLLAQGFIERQKVAGGGRGRPTYNYCLTPAGFKRAGADATDLAEAMWLEILSIESPNIRERLIDGVARRLGRQLAVRESNAADPAAAGHRVAASLQSREYPTCQAHGGAVIGLEACPFPILTDAADDRQMCRLEEKMLSEALGEPVRLTSCRLDGDACCHFSPIDSNGG